MSSSSRRLREHAARDPVAVRVLLPVEEVLRRRRLQRVAEDRRAAMRRRPQPDLVRRQVDQPVEAVGRAVLQRDADGHPAHASHDQSGFGSSREHPAQPLAPLRVDHLEIRIGFLDPALQPDAQAVGLVDERGRSAARPRCSSASSSRTTRACTWSLRCSDVRARDDAVDHRLAVLALADLEIAGVRRSPR